MKYNFFKCEKEGQTLAAVLQSVLRFRRFYEPSQGEIVDRIGRDDNFSLDSARKFLGEYNTLLCYHDLSDVSDVSSFLEDKVVDSLDVIAGFDGRVVDVEYSGKRVFSSVLCYDPENDKVFLHLPFGGKGGVERRLRGKNGLVSFMNAQEDGFGFYVLDSCIL